MFKQKRGLLMLVVLTLILGSFFTSPKNVIATEVEDGEEVQRALDWIKGEQDEDGFWDEETYEVYGEAYQLYTTKVIETIGKYNYLPENYEGGLGALRSIDPTNNDYLARYLSIEDLKQYYEVKKLTDSQNEDGGWGILPGHSSNTVDTMLAVKALINNSQYHNTETMNRALRYLTDKQNHDGSWSYTQKSNPNIALTAEITIILSEFRTSYKLTSNQLETSMHKGVEYLVSMQGSEGTWGTDKDNINGTLLSYRAVSSILGETYVEGIHEKIKDMQGDKGSWYEDAYTTALAVDALKTKGKKNTITKLDNIKTYKYDEDKKIEIEEFNPNENVIIEMEGEYNEEEVELSILIKKPDGNIEKVEKEEIYLWNTGQSSSGAYTIVAMLKDKEEGRTLNTLEKDINIKEHFNISNIIIGIEPKETRVDTNTEVSIIGSLINESNTDNEVEVKITVTDENNENIIDKTHIQNCRHNQQIINIPTTKFKPKTGDTTTYLIKAEVYLKGQVIANTQREFKVLPPLPPARIDTVQQLSKQILSPGTDNVEALIKLIGEGTPEAPQRKPMDIALILDNSESMTGARWTETKEASKIIVDMIQGSDRAAIIGFSYGAWIEQEFTEDKELLKTKINQMRNPAYGTGMNDGIRIAIELAEVSSGENREKIFILLSDGHPSSVEKVISETNIAQEKGIKILTLGLGNEINVDLLRNIAQITGGTYHYSPTPQKLREIMAEVAREIFDIAGKSITFETTIPNNNMNIDIEKIEPRPSEVIENEDKTKTLKWNFDKIIMGQDKSIKIKYIGENLKPDTEEILTQNTKLTYLDKNETLIEKELESLKIPVRQYSIDTKINTDKEKYKSEEEVKITVGTKNLTQNETSFIGQIDITDEKNNIVKTISKEEINWTSEESKTLDYSWNTEKYLQGKYKVKVTWIKEDKETSKQEKIFEITSDKEIENKVTTDKIEYNSNETVKITDKINNPSENSIQDDLKLKNILIDDKNEEIWTNESKLKELLPNDSTSITSNWDTESNLPGEYTLISKVYKEDNLISEDSTKFIILDSKETAIGVIGKLNSIPKSIYPTEEINLTYKITNIGNSNLENIEQRIRIIDPETEEIIETITDTISLQIGKTKESNKTWSYEPLKVGNYLVVYDAILDNGQEIPLDSQGFRVEKPEVSGKILGGSIFLNKKDGDNNLQIPLITQLQGNASIYTGMTKYNDRVPIEINDGESSELFESLNDRGSSDIASLNKQIKRAQTGGTYKLEIKEPAEGRISSSNRIKTEYLTRVDKEADKIEFNYGLTKEDVINHLSPILPLHSDLEYENYINGTKLFPSVSKPTDINITDSRNLNISPINSKKEIDLKEHKGISTNRKLEIKERGELTLRTDPNTVIYLDRGIEISQGGKLNIEADGRLDIYISQQAQIDGSIFVNKGIGEVNIYMIGREDFHANNRAQIIGINLYAPDSEVQLDNHVEFVGTIICKHLQMDDTAKFRKH